MTSVIPKYKVGDFLGHQEGRPGTVNHWVSVGECRRVRIDIFADKQVVSYEKGGSDSWYPEENILYKLEVVKDVARVHRLEPINLEGNFAKRLRSLREIQGLSLRDVEQLTGVSNASISQMENNKIDSPSVFTVKKLAVTYGVSVDYLLEGL